jgi:sigma-E factor negative regulatory protein RseA
MDNELDPKDIGSAVNDVCGDRNLRDSWNRYHLIGDALRGEPLSLEAAQLADKVRERLAAEPTPLSSRRPVQRRWLQVAGGSALAASVAMFAWIAGPAYFGDVSSPVAARLAASSPPVATPNLYQTPNSYQQGSGTTWDVQRPEVATTLNRYLVNHQAYSPASGMKGMLPYATFASYDARP